MNNKKDIRFTVQPQDLIWRGKAKERLDQLTMPHWALGRLMDLAIDLAGITRSLKPETRRKAVIVMAADHGVVSEGVSNYPQEVTVQMVANFVNRGAGINALAGQAGAEVRVVDMGVAGELSGIMGRGAIVSMPVGRGTANIAAGPAMTREQALQSIENGISVARGMIEGEGFDLIAVGEMGFGNTTASSAIISAITGKPAADVTGRGTGISDEQVHRKIAVIERALQVNRPVPGDGIDVLAKVGGFEIGGIAGVIIGAAMLRRPVIIDGLITTAGALIAWLLAPESADYMIASHRSVEKGHAIALRHLGKEPLLDLNLRLGEGTGAALAMNLVEAAARILTEVKTFAEAHVSEAVE
ncbi:MAG: nicotinate-nucleotide--dimethylbenzimidazole phosphoribosyltransferase [Spirochaetes bacterium RBG_16_49_21]|nr:MAG: nicotinate-nucleotide--dimethylbenzimidazole phosphoribosyltransferase [Spirochaetes bacterium RBG_16_49_21]